MFLHHCDCDHYLIVSDVRLEPIPPVNPEDEPLTTAATATTSNSNVEGLDKQGGKTAGGSGGSRCDGGYVEASRGDTVTASAHDKAVGGRTAAAGVALEQAGLGSGLGSGSGSGGGGEALSLGGERRLRKKVVDEYPRLTYRMRPQVRRCEVCTAKVAVYMSFGHPLSDMVRIREEEEKEACVEPPLHFLLRDL